DHRVMAEGDFRIGLNEVQVGLPLPGVIHVALTRQVGPRIAERLAVRGLMLDAGEALRVGLVDELAPVDDVVTRALGWCRSLLALPPQAMQQTRLLPRADMVEMFRDLGEADYQRMLTAWFSVETQATLRALVEQLKKK